MSYKSVVATRKGSPEVLQIVENDLRAPRSGEARIRVLATTIGRTDIGYRTGDLGLGPKPPFVPGYEVLGIVDAVGEGVTDVALGDRVAALTGHGGWAEYIYLGQEHLVPIPPALAWAEAAAVVLNYTTAYQMLHRVAKVKAGDKILVIGASGGVGTALLQLGQLIGLKMYGTASRSKHATIDSLDTTLIDYHAEDFVAVLSQAEPNGVDYVFDGMGGAYADRSLKVLRRGGKLVEYAPSASVGALVRGLVKLLVANVTSTGKSIEAYGISALYKMDKKPFKTDLPLLFEMLAQAKIRPLIAAKFPLLEAAKGNMLLESGQVTGTIVLLAPERLT